MTGCDEDLEAIKAGVSCAVLLEPAWCMDQTCGRSCPSPVPGHAVRT